MIANDLTQLIGHTPMLRLQRFGAGLGVEILANQDATVFFDAIQFEKGTELTEYEP